MMNKNITNGGLYMALIKCPECKKKISDVAEKCPNCGKTITEADIVNAYENKRKREKRKQKRRKNKRRYKKKRRKEKVKENL